MRIPDEDMAQGPEALFEAIRKDCPPAVWSRGVELTRAEAVVGETSDDEEVVLRVTTRGGMFCPRVTLYPEDLDWDCECPGRQPVCEHVAAAVIAWRRSREQGGRLPAPARRTGRVGYRFQRAAGGLALERVVVHEGGEDKLHATLVAVAEGRVAGPRFAATQADLSAELALGTHRHGVLAPGIVSRVFARLAEGTDVTLDGRPVSVSNRPVLPVAIVRDRGEGFEVVVEAEVRVTERFANGALLCGETLRVVGDPQLTARERSDFENGKYFSPDEIAELLTDVLPSLERRIAVRIETDRLPRTVSEPPRAVIDVEREGHALSVLPTLVYGTPPTARIDGGRVVHLGGPLPLRDEQAERNEIRRLARLGLVPGVRQRYEGLEAVAFTARLAAWSGEVRGAGREHFRLAGPLEPQLRTSPGGFEVTFRAELVSAGATQATARSADARTVVDAWRRGESLVPLMGGGWAPLPQDWLDRHGPRVADLLAARSEDGSLPRCCMPELARLCEELDEPVPADLGRLQELAAGFEGIPDSPLPEDLATTLRGYQRHGVDWLAFVRDAGLGAMLADDMGLGKTVQALCALRGPALVVAPTSVLHNWANEIAKHRPSLRYSLFHGSSREIDPEADVTLTTYGVLRLDAERLADRRWETVILDEAQRIKNPDSQVSVAAFGLDAGFRLTLSGTPVENRLEELWSQFHFINRGLLGGRKHFRESYADPIADGDAQALARLRERIRPFLLRRLKSEVATELPPRTEMVLECELSEAERDIYDTVRAATVKEVVERLGQGGGVLAALTALLRLRQAACHGSLVPGRTLEHSSKVRLLLDALDTVVADGHKALVFSQWTSLLDLVQPELAAAGIRHVRLDGSTRDRAGVVREFQEDEKVAVMLISLKAGGTGLNLTAADHVFLLDPWWNPAVEDQAADRAHRIGQDRPVMIYRLVALDTVEEGILALQERKRELARAALEGAGQAAALTRDDLLDLLR